MTKTDNVSKTIHQSRVWLGQRETQVRDGGEKIVGFDPASFEIWYILGQPSTFQVGVMNLCLDKATALHGHVQLIMDSALLQVVLFVLMIMSYETTGQQSLQLASCWLIKVC